MTKPLAYKTFQIYRKVIFSYLKIDPFSFNLIQGNYYIYLYKSSFITPLKLIDNSGNYTITENQFNYLISNFQVLLADGVESRSTNFHIYSSKPIKVINSLT